MNLFKEVQLLCARHLFLLEVYVVVGGAVYDSRARAGAGVRDRASGTAGFFLTSLSEDWTGPTPSLICIFFFVIAAIIR